MTDSPNLSAHNIAWKDRAAHAPITPGGSPNPLSVVESVGFIPTDDLSNGFETASDIATRTVRITFFPDEAAQSLLTADLTLSQLADRIAKEAAASKMELPWLKLAVFGNNRSEKNCLRTNVNVLHVTGIEAEHDAGEISFDTAIAVMRKAGIRSLLYTSPSYAPTTKERWRILVPLSRNYSPETREKLVARINGMFGGKIAPESFVLSQAYLLGHVDNPDHRVEVTDGDFLDLRDDLYAGSIFKDGSRVGDQTANGRSNGAGPQHKSRKDDDPEPVDLDKIEAALNVISSDCNYKTVWMPIGGALFQALGDSGFALFDRWSAKAPARYNADQCRESWRGFRSLRNYTIATIFHFADKADPGWRERYEDEERRRFFERMNNRASAGGDEAGGGDQPGTSSESDVERLNKMHAVLPIGGKTRVVTFGELEEFPGRETIVMTQTIPDFRSLQDKYRHTYRDKKGELQTQPLGTHWISSPKRRQFDGGMAFMPQHDGDLGNRLNLFRGFGVKAIKPDGTSGAAGCGKFLDFMRDIICSGNEAHFEYLRKREATIFQKRIRSEIALGLRTKEEGCGKGFYEATMGRLLGNHAMQVTNPKHIVGNFNPHLETLLRLTADEALFVGNPEHRNALFGLITEPTLTIEPKGCGLYKADSYLNLSITSNAEHFLPVSGTARRFLIPTVSAARMQDFTYFAGLKEELEGGGYEALLYHLLHEVDLADFNVRLVPQTEGLRQQRNHSLPPLEAWWCELLETGTLMGADPTEPNRAVSNTYMRQVEIETKSRYGDANTQIRHVTQLGIYDQAKLIEPRLKNHTSDHRLGAHLSEMGCDNRGRVLRRRGWTFPPLLQCRGAWEKRYPDWKWRDAEITEWRAEEADDAEEGDHASGF